VLIIFCWQKEESEKPIQAAIITKVPIGQDGAITAINSALLLKLAKISCLEQKTNTNKSWIKTIADTPAQRATINDVIERVEKK